MKIIIETIPMKEQRYNTCGDWRWDKEHNVLSIKVSQMENVDDPLNGNVCGHGYLEAVVGIHELVEALACEKAGITEKQVDAFDMDKKMQKDVEALEIESGDHPSAPYKQQHTLATGIERILCYAFGVPWYEYENQLIEMTEEYDAE